MIPKKRYKHDRSSIEVLPNELFLAIFSYLPKVDVVYIFGRLNQRFHSLTLSCYDRLDLTATSKIIFDYVTRQHSMNRWRSIRLSDDDQTPGQITYFFRNFPIAQCLSQLESLEVINMQPQTALIIFPELVSFSRLVSLTIGSICGKLLPDRSFPSLKHLVINSCIHTQWMKNLEVTHLEHRIEYFCSHEYALNWPKTLQNLKVFFSKSGGNELVRLALRDLSQLTTLAVNDNAWQNSPPNGQIWQELITTYIPALENFHFAFKFWKDFSPQSDITRVVSTFSTPFYLKEKRWFVQCDAHHQPLSVAFLYSIPYAFQRFDIVTHSFDESLTSGNPSTNKNLYENVRTITIDVKCQKINQALITGYITHLFLKFPGTPMNWIYSLKHLRQLSLENHIDISTNDFIRLLENAVHLHSLIVPYYTLQSLTDQWKNVRACHLLSERIRSLKIPYSVSFCDYVKVDEVTHLVRIFSRRCQHIYLSVYSRNIIAGYLLVKMEHLRSLHVRLIEHNNDMNITQQWLNEQNLGYENLDYQMIVNENKYSFWFANR